MGLFDRLFWKKEETEKVLPSSEEVTESTEVEETVKEETTATSNDKGRAKIADMEALPRAQSANCSHSSTCFNRRSRRVDRGTSC